MKPVLVRDRCAEDRRHEAVAEQGDAQVEVERRRQHPRSQRDPIELRPIAVGEFCRRVCRELEAGLRFVLEHVDELLARREARRATSGRLTDSESERLTAGDPFDHRGGRCYQRSCDGHDN